MLIDPRVFVFLGTNALFLFLTLLVNSTLATWSVYLLMLGPMLVLPPLFLRHSSFFICILLTGLWVDAALPSPFGIFTISFLILSTFLFYFRFRFRVEHNYHPILLAHASNFFCFLVLIPSHGISALNEAHYWLHWLITLVASHTALFVLAPWFFNLQRLLIDLFNLEKEPEDLPVL